MATKKKGALGRGLGALIDDAKYEPKYTPEETAENSSTISLKDIVPNPFQPRTKFDDEALKELAESIKELGIIQPVTVRKIDDGKFQLISGERRFRAATIANLEEVPAFVREATDQEMLEFALVENIQREDLNAIEISLTYQRLMEECNLTQENLSVRVGKNRSTVNNYLRLLKLPSEIQIGLRDGKISMSHARALINIENPENQLKVYFQILNKGLSVRQAEEMAKKLSEQAKIDKNAYVKKDKDALPEQYAHFAERLKENLESNVKLTRGKNGKGKIIIPFGSDKDLDRIIDMMNKIETSGS